MLVKVDLINHGQGISGTGSITLPQLLLTTILWVSFQTSSENLILTLTLQHSGLSAEIWQANK